MAVNIPAATPGVAVARDGKGKWQKGQTGNPRGRPPAGESIAELIRQKLDKSKFAEKLCRMAEGGDLDAARLILSYVEPPPAKGGKPELLKGAGVSVNINYLSNVGLPGAVKTVELREPIRTVEGSCNVTES